MKHWTMGLTAAWMVAMAAGLAAGEEKPRLAVGEFYAAKAATPPTIDGKISPGEWDHALTTSGMITVFDHELMQVETTMSFTWDDKNFYFLMNCQRAPGEFHLQKKARQNDDYDFGDPSVEIWVTPPTAVPETYQNIINTYPAVMDVKNIPSRGYVGQGWKGNWKMAVSEDADRYIIEASIPTKDFGFESVKSGDVWQLLLCRTAIGAKPRPQGDWSVTQGYAEIPQHPKVHLVDKTPVLQVYGVTSVFTGDYSFPMAVALGDAAAEAKVDVELRWQKDVTPGEGDKVEKQSVTVKPGMRNEFKFAGQTPDKKGFFAITATSGGVKIFQQNFPYVVNGYVYKQPQPPAGFAVRELDIQTMYGPQTNTVLVKADVLDLPSRKDIASTEAKLIDESGKVLKAQILPPFVEWYAFGTIALSDVKGLDIPVEDLTAKQKGEQVGPAGGTVKPIKLQVEVAVKDKSGAVLKTQRQEVALKRYKTPWENSNVGVSDKVIPPWTPMTAAGDTVGVWNRKMAIDGLGLLKKIDNGGVDQVSSMRLVAIQDGKEVPLTADAGKIVKQTDARVDLVGQGAGAGLKVSAETKAEFDGFVLVNYTIAPSADSAKVDNLYLEVVLPESEGTHMCTTAGGWTAFTDVTPAYWSSATTASGMLFSNFVPYVWLTNSDRAFLWFADSDKGWITDDSKTKPTLEVIRNDGKVTLRVHFIEVPSELKGSRTLTWGYQTFPSRPLPAGWRMNFCANPDPKLPHAKNFYFWNDADYYVLWPYYSSPFPHDMAKSKAILDGTRKSENFRPSPGSIAHSIGHYFTYEGALFPEYVVDWGATPGVVGNADVTNSAGPVDFRLYYYQRWVREAGLRGIYVDENYLSLEDNFLTGNAYFRTDGKLQRAYSYIGLRDYFKRLRIMFEQNNVPTPNLWQHITGGAAYHAWFGDIFFEGENVEPTNEEYDYIEVLPAGRMRSIGSAVCSGGAMTMMCQSQRHSTVYAKKHTHQFVGWVMAHDILPEQVQFFNKIAEDAHLYEADVQFLPYWKNGPITTATKDCVISAHKTGKRALLWIVNTSRSDATVDVAIDFAKLGLDPAKTKATNAETGAAVALTPKGLSQAVEKRDFVAVHLVQE